MNSDDTQLLLELHAQDRRAHLAGDADLLAAGMADHIWEASRGQLTRLARSDVRDRFASYFGAVRYARWDDLLAPHVHVSADGHTSWMAIHIEAEVRAADQAEESPSRRFESSWIATYQKLDGSWRMVGISSSVVDRP
jgi:hypothetical protein